MDRQDAISGRLDPRTSARIAARAAMLSMAAAGFLVMAKAAAAWWTGSVSLLASMADSGLDLVASGFTLWAVNRASAPPDERYAYGYGKTEGFAALAQAGLVGASAALVGREAALRLQDPAPLENSGVAIGVMVLSILITSGLITLQTRAIRKTGSLAVSGDRAHYAADLSSNVIVLLGVGFSLIRGFEWVDAVAGLLVAGWLAWGGLQVGRGAVDQLMDREAPETARTRIMEIVRSVSGRDAHRLRTRMSGPILHIQFHLDVPADLPMSEAHRIMVECEVGILAEFPGADILIHPDPEDATEPHAADFFRDAPGRRQLPDRPQ
jgi:cation diffusion facilitator family transporter